MYYRAVTWTLGIFLVVTTSASQLRADVVFFSDRDDFNDATSGLNFWGFNFGFSGPTSLLPPPHPGFTMSVIRAQQPFTPGANSRVVSEGSLSVQYTSSANDTLVTITFNVPINAFAIDIKDWGTTNSGRLLVENNTNSFSEVLGDVDPSTHLEIGNLIFFGVIDDDPFTSIRILSNTQGDLIGLDAMLFGQAANVPEPSSLLTALVAVFGLAWRRKRGHSTFSRR